MFPSTISLHAPTARHELARTVRAVLMIGNFLSQAIPGTRHPCEDLAARLRGLGWQVLTASARPGRIPRAWDMLRTAWKLRREYAVAHVDVYGKAAFLWAEAVCTMLTRLGKPYLLTLHDGDFPAFALRHPRRVRRLLGSARAVTVPSGYLQHRMKPYRSDLMLLPNALDLGAYPFRARDHAGPRLIWVRAFHEMYNPALAVQMLARVSRDVPDLHLTMLGRSKHDGSWERVEALVRSLKLADRVAMPGGVAHADVPRWLDGADIFLNTTNVDNTPLSVLEAMAAGLCVVSTDVGGIRYLLNHETDSLLVPPNNLEQLSEAVYRLLTDHQLAQRLSHTAHATARQYDWSAILPRWDRLLTWAASTREAQTLPC